MGVLEKEREVKVVILVEDRRTTMFMVLLAHKIAREIKGVVFSPMNSRMFPIECPPPVDPAYKNEPRTEKHIWKSKFYFGRG